MLRMPPCTPGRTGSLYCERPCALVPAQCDSGEEDIAVFQSWGTREPPAPLPLPALILKARPTLRLLSPQRHPGGRGVLGMGRWSEQPPTWTPLHLTPPLIENLNLKLQLTGEGLHPLPLPPTLQGTVYLGWGEGHWRNGRGWTGTCQPIWGTYRSPTPGTPVPLLRAQSDHGHVLPPSTFELTWKLCQPCLLPGLTRVPDEPPTPTGSIPALPTLGERPPSGSQEPLSTSHPESRSDV